MPNKLTTATIDFFLIYLFSHFYTVLSLFTLSQFILNYKFTLLSIQYQQIYTNMCNRNLLVRHKGEDDSGMGWIQRQIGQISTRRRHRVASEGRSVGPR